MNYLNLERQIHTQSVNIIKIEKVFEWLNIFSLLYGEGQHSKTFTSSNLTPLRETTCICNMSNILIAYINQNYSTLHISIYLQLIFHFFKMYIKSVYTKLVNEYKEKNTNYKCPVAVIFIDSSKNHVITGEFCLHAQNEI